MHWTALFYKITFHAQHLEGVFKFPASCIAYNVAIVNREDLYIQPLAWDSTIASICISENSTVHGFPVSAPLTMEVLAETFLQNAKIRTLPATPRHVPLPNPELTGLSYWISISRIERSANAFAPPASALPVSLGQNKPFHFFKRGAKEHAMGLWNFHLVQLGLSQLSCFGQPDFWVLR
jgi:hypothetical protein